MTTSSRKAWFRATRERCGISQKAIAERFGVKVLTVKRWEKPGEAEPPEDVRQWLEYALEEHLDAVGAVLYGVDAISGIQGKETPTNASLDYYRSQAHYDEYRSDENDYAVVNACTREVAAILENRGVSVRYRYPEDDTPDLI